VPEFLDNSQCDEHYRASLPKPQVLARKIGIVLDIGVVAAYTSLEVYEREAILGNESTKRVNKDTKEDLRNLQLIESAIGFTALQDLIDKHQESVADRVSYGEVEPFSEEEQMLRQKLDQTFINDHLIFTQ
jgi:hypothetical protein